MNKKAIFALVFGTLCVTVFTVATIVGNNTNERLEEFGELTVGTIYELRSDYLRFRYEVDGEQFTWGVKRPHNYFQVGEHYEILYDPNDPETIKVIYSKPIITDNFLTTEPLKIEQRIDGRIRFEYLVNGEISERICLATDSSYSTSSHIVHYNPNNPKIGYLTKK